MLLVRPSAMLRIQINALIYRCYSTKKKKKPLEGSLSPQLVSRNDPST
jgi:transposase